MWLLTYTVCLSVLLFEGVNHIVAGAKSQQDKISSNYFYPTECEADTTSLNLEPTLYYSESSDVARQSYNNVNDPTKKSEDGTQYFGQAFSELELTENCTTEKFTPTEREHGVQLNNHNENKMLSSIKSEMATTLLQSSDDEDGTGIKQVPVVGPEEDSEESEKTLSLEEDSEEPEKTLSYISPVQTLEKDFKENQSYTGRSTERNIGLENETEYNINRKHVQQFVPESNDDKFEEAYDQSVTRTVNIEFKFKPVTPAILRQLHVPEENIFTCKAKEALVASDSDIVPERPQKQSLEKHRRTKFTLRSTLKYHRTMFTGRKLLPNDSARALRKGKGKTWLTNGNLSNQPKVIDGTAGAQKWNLKALQTPNIFETTEAPTFPIYVTKETEAILSNNYISSFVTGIPTNTVQENLSSEGIVPECYKINSTRQSTGTANNRISNQGNVRISSIRQPYLTIADEQVITQGNFANTEISSDTNQRSIENIIGQINKVSVPNSNKNDDTDQKDPGNVNLHIINQGKDPVRETTEGLRSDNNSPQSQNQKVIPNKKLESLPEHPSEDNGQNSAQVEVKIKVGFGPGSSTCQETTYRPPTVRFRPRSTTCRPTICPTTCPTICPTTCPTICPTKFPTICPTTCPTMCPTTCPTKCPTCPTICPTICPPTCPTTCESNILAERVHLLKCLCNTTACPSPSTTMFNINEILCPSTQNCLLLPHTTRVTGNSFSTPAPALKDETHSSTEPWYWCCFKKAMGTSKINKESIIKTVVASENVDNSSTSGSNMLRNQTDGHVSPISTKSSTSGIQPGTSSTLNKNMSTDANLVYQQTCPYLSTSLAQEVKNQESLIAAPASNVQENVRNGEDSSHTAPTNLVSLTKRAYGSDSMSQLSTTPITDKLAVESSSTQAQQLLRPQDLQYVSLITLSTAQYVAYASRREAAPQATLRSSRTETLSRSLKQQLKEAMNLVTQPIPVEAENPSHTTTNAVMDVKMLDQHASQSVSPLIPLPYVSAEIPGKLSGYIGNQFQNNIIGNEVGKLGKKKPFDDYLFSRDDVRYVNANNILSTLKYEEEIKSLLRNGMIKNPSLHESMDEGKIKGDNMVRGERNQIPLKYQDANKNSFSSLKDQKTEDSELKETNQWNANIMTKNQKVPIRVRVKFIYDPTAEKALNANE